MFFEHQSSYYRYCADDIAETCEPYLFELFVVLCAYGYNKPPPSQ